MHPDHGDAALLGSPSPDLGGPAAGEPVVVARGLTKRFGGFTAVDSVDFTIVRGEVFGFLGPNGAGKTSTMRMLSCLSPVSGGTLRVLGLDPGRDGPSIRRRLGLVPQDDTLDLELSVRDNLYLYGRYFDIPKKETRARVERLLAFAQLVERGDDEVDTLSGGMKRRLTIARALVSEPELVVLDEPTTGLDPQARHLVWERLYRLKQQGVTLVITTHYMDEAEQLCDRLVVMDRGRIVATGSPRQLIATYATREVAEIRLPGGRHDELAPRLEPLAARVEVLPDRLLCYADDGEAVLRAVRELGLTPESALVRRASLEDVFLRLTGRLLVE